MDRLHLFIDSILQLKFGSSFIIPILGRLKESPLFVVGLLYKKSPKFWSKLWGLFQKNYA